VIKASLSAGTNYMGQKEINLDDNMVQGEACPTGGGAAPASSGATSQGPRLVGPPPAPSDDNVEDIGDNMAPPMSDLSIEVTSGTRETYLVSYGLPYDFRIRNDGADAISQLLVEVETSGVARIPVNQPAGSAQSWKAAGFDCPFGAGSSVTDRIACRGGWLRAGEAVTLRLFIRFVDAGQGLIEMGIRSSRFEVTDVSPDNNRASREVQVLRVP
jgi:hypothetical protein